VRAALAAAALAAALVLAVPAGASAGRIAVGLAEGASPDEVAALAEAATGGAVDRTLEPLGAVVVSVEDVGPAAAALEQLPGVAYVEPIRASRTLAFVPNDPLFSRQWYLASIEAFESWDGYPSLPPVRVAVVDSGIDATHPDLAGRILEARSFVSTSARVDTVGHGTMVAGEIAAATDNGEGIAGVGLPVQLLIAKVVNPSGGISVEVEAKAIRWAADHGARVINLSLGGRRDPTSTVADTYSPLEQAAIEYAYGKGAVIVAATGNCSDVCPYRWASYPAALPHVIGVSAMTQFNQVAGFSNRDPVFNDLIAPGAGIVSTFPFSLTDPGCQFPGYSLCAQNANGSGDGTSFAAPLASAAAALLIAERPRLHPSQVMALLEGTTRDLSPGGRDALSGTGLLSVPGALAALQRPLPPTDRLEPNDDAGDGSYTLFGTKRTVRATIDYFDDPNDVYRVRIRAGQRLVLALHGPGGRSTLAVWRPGTAHIADVTAIAVRSGSVLAYRSGANPPLSYRAARTGWYYVNVKAPRRGGGAYTLAVAHAG
jgi:subtilisin family serine protease